MTEFEEKSQKKLIFRGSCVYWPDEHTKSEKATNLAWEFARAALRGEPLHLIDGFIFHDSWRLGRQNRDYLDLFQTNKSNAMDSLEELGIGGVKIDHLDKYYWQLHPPAEGLQCDITNAVRIARKSRQAFRKGDPESGWKLIRQSYEEYPDARSIYQALALAPSLPKDCKRYEDCLRGIKELLENYKKVLLHALAKVWCLALDERQGITEEIGKLAIDCWVSELFQVRQVLLLISGHKFSKPTASTEAIKEFAELVGKCRECNEHVAELKGKYELRDESAEKDLGLAEEDAAKFLKRLVECDAVVEAVEDTVRYYEQQTHLRISDSDVYARRQAAVEGFLRQGDDFPDDPNTLYHEFWVYFRNFVEKFNKGQGIKDILDSNKDQEEKLQQVRSILEGMEDEKEAKEELRRRFGIIIQQLGGQYEGFPIPAGVISSEKDLYRLLTVEQVLDVKSPLPAQWFRESGPIYSDFQQKKFYRRPEVDTVKEKILANHFFLLEGKAATAKSVIVRTVMHELYEAGEQKIYYVDVARRRNFGEDQLIRSIRAVSGLFVIENVHLETRKIQWIYERFANDPDRRFLFTWRRPDKEFQDPAAPRNLHEIDKLVLDPFTDAEQLVEAYCSDPKTPIIVRQKRQDILNTCKKDFWLLACALQGCGDAHGQGEPLSWVANKIRSRLVSLETCRDRHADRYPEIIVALSPLYKSEVLTYEKFLRKLGFTRAALNGLVERGEITWQKDPNGNHFYGLHHSSLADAYWEFGKDYIENESFRKYEEFLHQYAISGMPNGLEAVIITTVNTRTRVFARLNKNAKFGSVIRNEQSMVALATWIEYLQPRELADADVLKILAEKITLRSDFDQTGRCLWLVYKINKVAAKNLWAYVRKKTLSQQLAKSPDVLSAARFVWFVKSCDEDMAGELFWQTNRRFLAKMVEAKQNAYDMGTFLSSINVSNMTVAEEVCACLDLVKVASKLNNAQSRSSVIDFMDLVLFLDANGDITPKLCDLLTDQVIANLYRHYIGRQIHRP
jgi:hypothetical protein